MKKAFTYRFRGGHRIKMIEVRASVLGVADQTAQEIASQLSKRWGCRVFFSMCEDNLMDFFKKRLSSLRD